MEMRTIESLAVANWKMDRPWMRNEAEKWIHERGFFWGLSLATSGEVSAAAILFYELADTRYHMAREEQEANQEQKNDH